ncbi:MAG: hypothetical protein ABJN14_04415 [Paracoccaceae bacterium]
MHSLTKTRRLALAVLVPFISATSSFSQDNASQIDISGELTTSEQALHFVLSEDRVPNASAVKIERMKARFSERGNLWEFSFRDEDKTYEATVRQNRAFKLKEKRDEKGQNAAFWATMPDPKDVELPEAYLEKSVAVIETFNSTYTAKPRAIVEYEVCDAPKNGAESDFANGCRRDASKEVWEVFIEVNAVVRGEDDRFYKVIEFNDGQPVKLSDASVSGNW